MTAGADGPSPFECGVADAAISGESDDVGVRRPSLPLVAVGESTDGRCGQPPREVPA